DMKSYLSAHGVLVRGLSGSTGRWRQTAAPNSPDPQQIPRQMQELFDWLKKDTDTHFLVKSAAACYEIEHIQPFEESSSRSARFWQQLILIKNNYIFEHLPIEFLLEKRRKEYLALLTRCAREGKSTLFIEFLLEVVRETIYQHSGKIKQTTITGEDRLNKAKTVLGRRIFTRKEYMSLYKTISTATASRDLRQAVESGLVQKTGDKNNTTYVFK
ncbi:protein Fic family, partial [Candidatus Termititenax spirochaetophilus]